MVRMSRRRGAAGRVARGHRSGRLDAHGSVFGDMLYVLYVANHFWLSP